MSETKLGLAAALLVVAACGGNANKPAPNQPTTNNPATAPAPTGGGDATATQPAPPPAQKTLYERLGGEPAITAVVDEFVARTTSDPRVMDRFFNVDAPNLKKLLVEFVCAATGGPCKYEGRTMEASHASMQLVDDEFGAVVEDLSGALDKFNVPAKEKGELLGALGPLKPTMVVTADRLHPIDDAQLATVTKLADSLKAKDPEASRLLGVAVIAGKRGQRSYAEQLFSRAEMKAGTKSVASVAKVFRAGAPDRVTTTPKAMKDEGPQAAVVGGSETDEPIKKQASGSLHGVMTIDGKAADGFGVVMMWPKSGNIAKRTAKHRVIEQRNKAFAPHVMAVPVGSTIAFPNFDTIFHNVFSVSKPKSFDLGMYKNGESREIVVDKPGIIRIGCNLHASMAAFLIVVDAPAYVPTEPDGSFSFKSLAPGKWRVQAWNERSSAPLETEVDIKDGANDTKLDLKSGGEAVGPDKFNTPRDK
jgi:hemoglobin